MQCFVKTHTHRYSNSINELRAYFKLLFLSYRFYLFFSINISFESFGEEIPTTECSCSNRRVLWSLQGISMGWIRIAVKKLMKESGDMKNEKEFLTELSNNSHVCHPNSALLVGYYVEIFILSSGSPRMETYSALHSNLTQMSSCSKDCGWTC